jgi:phosphatidate cytidylyltransferase
LADPEQVDPSPARGRRRGRWGDLGLRVLSAAILAPLALGCIWLGAAPYAVLVLVATLGLAVEWVHLCGYRGAGVPGGLVPAVALAVAAVAMTRSGLAAIEVLLVGLGLAWAVARSAGRPGARGSPLSLALGTLYIGAAGIALVFLRADAAAGRLNLCFLIAVVWASDIGAYVAGRLFGGPLLAPSISPSKTWAGAAGGLLAAVGAGAAVSALLAGTPDLTWRLAVTAGLIGLVCQAGDLMESLIKRRFGVKDSGTLIPGHGGLLDRLDGLLAAAPAAALLALALGPGVVLWQ